MDRLKSLSVLLRVVELGSFSRCAQESNVGQPTVSRAIDGLERELGVRILHRNTRRLSLTEDGKRVLAEAKKVIGSYEDLLSASQLKSLPKGVIRVTCPTALGSIYLIPALRRFMKTHPQIKIHLQVTDAYLDLFENDIDVGLRVGELPSSQTIAKNVGSLPRIAVASEPYLNENPAPKLISDLTNHSCIIVKKAGRAAIWQGITADKKPFSVEINARFVVDNHLALLAAVDAGLGIGLAAKFIFEEKGILRKRLNQVLKKIEFKPYPVSLVFNESKNLPARTRLFIDFFYEDLRKQPWIET